MTDSNLKVTQIASGDLWAGAEVQLYTLCKALLKLNKLELNVILLNHGELEKKLIALGAQVRVYDESKLNSFQIYTLICKHLIKYKPHIIHSHRLKENILSSFAAKHIKIPYSIRTLHGAPEFEPRWSRPHKKFLIWLNKITGRYLQQKIIAVSPILAKDIENDFPREKILLIENGIDIEKLAEYAITPLKKKLNIPLKIGIVGRMVSVKRVDVFLKIAQNWIKNHPDKPAEFYIYGGGPLKDELKQLAKNLGILDFTHFEGHCQNIHEKIAKLDALLITSDHEGLPMTLLEAMTLGTPVIAHSVGGITNLLNDNCGWLVDSQEAELFINGMLSCILNPDEKITRLNLAQNKIKNFYSDKTNAEAYLALYQDLVNS